MGPKTSSRFVQVFEIVLGAVGERGGNGTEADGREVCHDGHVEQVRGRS